MRQRRTTGEVHQEDCSGGLAPRRQQQQGSERLKDARRGVPNGSVVELGLPGAQLPENQCTFMSLSAIIYFTLVKPFPQSEDDMLAILNRGNS
ncbi:hypothetical protein TYRP_015875 [Tyrophagus putrescentiae]|nr:hypothetical protein TYRP_015875 [Tyrophagus putrescentiae]